MRILIVLPDALGGKGGIAKFNTDFLRSLCSEETVSEILCYPRLKPKLDYALPAPKLLYRIPASQSLFKYVVAILTQYELYSGFDVVICGHIHLLPIAYWLGRWNGAPVYMIMHGMEVWHPTCVASRPFLSGIAGVIAVSRFTLNKFRAWSGNSVKGFILPNSVDLDRFVTGPKPKWLLERFGLYDKSVILTLGRLSAVERWKGFDRVIGVLPQLIQEVPGIRYLVVGEGDDESHLKAMAKKLGVSEYVIFTGFIPEKEKPDIYRLADLYVMPSCAEGFGIVYLEALASGVPVVGSTLDASPEVLQGGAWGYLVNPNDPNDLIAGILMGLKAPRRPTREQIARYSFENFHNTCGAILRSISEDLSKKPSCPRARSLTF